MMDQIQQIINQLTEKEVAGNNNISNNLAGNVAKETGNTLMEGLQNAVSGGNMGDLMNMLSGDNANGLTSSPMVQNMINSLSSKLGSNVGLDAGTSSNFASSIIPQIISMITGKAKSGDFNITDILSSFTGGDAAKMFDQNGDGKLGIDDAISAVKKGNLGDLLGGFFGK